MIEKVINRKILIVEDNLKSSTEMISYFENKNFIFSAKNLKESILILNSEKNFDIILLDIILPDGFGTDIFKIFSFLPPVIILSVIDQEDQILEGFNSGAVDYILKPCSMRLLEARMALRLLPKEYRLISFKDFKIDAHLRTVFWREQQLSLTTSEYNILYFLATHPNRYFNSDQIYEAVWEAPSMQTATIRRHLSTLRRKLNETTINEVIIYTEFGRGYCFIPPIKEVH